MLAAFVPGFNGFIILDCLGSINLFKLLSEAYGTPLDIGLINCTQLIAVDESFNLVK